MHMATRRTKYAFSTGKMELVSARMMLRSDCRASLHLRVGQQLGHRREDSLSCRHSASEKSCIGWAPSTLATGARTHAHACTPTCTASITPARRLDFLVAPTHSIGAPDLAHRPSIISLLSLPPSLPPSPSLCLSLIWLTGHLSSLLLFSLYLLLLAHRPPIISLLAHKPSIVHATVAPVSTRGHKRHTRRAVFDQHPQDTPARGAQLRPDAMSSDEGMEVRAKYAQMGKFNASMGWARACARRESRRQGC